MFIDFCTSEFIMPLSYFQNVSVLEFRKGVDVYNICPVQAINMQTITDENRIDDGGKTQKETL